MLYSYIKSLGSYFPEKVVSNDDLSQIMDTNDAWIFERTGIKNRRIAHSHELTSDLAYKASMDAIKKAKLDVNDIDMILFSITYSEQSFPNTASRLQQKLGITNKCACLDINAACTGWVYGVELADSLIKSGKYKNILLVGGEKPSSFLDWSDRNSAILFGDGCGVAIISCSENDNSYIIDSYLKSDSAYIDDLALINGGQAKPFTLDDFSEKKYPYQLYMNGKRIFKEAVNTMEHIACELLQRNNFTLQQVDKFIPHQANIRIIEALAKKLEISDSKVAVNIQDYGNTSSATIPTLLSQLYEKNEIKRGDLLLLTSFGAGLTAGGIILRF